MGPKRVRAPGGVVTTARRVSRQQAGLLLDFGGRPDAAGVSQELVEEQLDGAVAAHNLLQDHGVAYIADEVGTGKTLIAAGVLALLRHDDPGMRALVIAPGVNLQTKWQRELRSFARHNVRFPDLRVRGVDNTPVRSPRTPTRLADVLRAWAEEPECDVVARLSSFQLGHRQRTKAERVAYIDGWREQLGASANRTVRQLLDEAAQGRRDVKETIAACANRLLPDLGALVVDEAHNLKGGVERGAARNRVVWTLLGHNSAFDSLPSYRPRAERVLLLSATPMEDDTAQLLAQLQVLEVAGCVPDLTAEDEQTRLEALHTFLFRRLTKLRVAGQTLTRNQYRQEWRAGGTQAPDLPLTLGDVRGQLTFALVQKRVADALNNGGAKPQFQVGMLTSFESLAESVTHRLVRSTSGAEPDDEPPPFDGTEQNRIATEDERRGIDEDGIRALVSSHLAEFGRPPSHPKMDAVVDRLVEGARCGRKALVFTRRVASVDEIVQRVNDRIDTDLERRLRAELPGLSAGVDRLVQRYRNAGSVGTGDADANPAASHTPAAGDPDVEVEQPTESAHPTEADDPTAEGEATEEVRGGRSLFAWLFRQRPPKGMLTGWWLRQRLEEPSGGYVTLLRDNHVAAVLGCAPGQAMTRLQEALPEVADPMAEVDALAQLHLGPVRPVSMLRRFQAAQLAGLQLLDQHGTGEIRRRAAVARAVLSATAPTRRPPGWRPVSVADRLSEATLATALRADPDLCSELWHERLAWDWNGEDEFRRREWRWLLLASAVRLDFPAIDLWLCEVRRRCSLTASAGELDATALVEDFVQVLHRQRDSHDEVWSSYRALRATAQDADLVLAVNGVRLESGRVPPWVGNRVPAVGMAGQVNTTAVSQFRTATYPLVLVSTDLLQQGEDLHTFCDEVHHYGIAWMPSSLEQRTGRVDRVNSLTERRLSQPKVQLQPDGRPAPDQRLQVLYPFVSGTYEELQARRVFDRLNEHIRLLHEEFGRQVPVSPRLDPDEELAQALKIEPPPMTLGEPYRIDPRWLSARRRRYPVVGSHAADAAIAAFTALASRPAWGPCPVQWAPIDGGLHLLGECRLDQRYQPVELRLSNRHGRVVVHMTSPVGVMEPEHLAQLLQSPGELDGARLGATPLGPRHRRTFSVTVEDVIFVPARGDLGSALEPRVVRVVEEADELEERLLGSDKRIAHFAWGPHAEAGRD